MSLSEFECGLIGWLGSSLGRAPRFLNHLGSLSLDPSHPTYAYLELSLIGCLIGVWLVIFMCDNDRLRNVA